MLNTFHYLRQVQQQSRSISLLIGRLEDFPNSVLKDRIQALHLLQAYREIVDKGAAFYQGTINSDFQGAGCKLDFKSLQNAVDSAFYIQSRNAEQAFNLPLIITRSDHTDVAKSEKELSGEIYLHQWLKDDVKSISGRKLSFSKAPLDHQMLWLIKLPDPAGNRRHVGVAAALIGLALLFAIFVLPGILSGKSDATGEGVASPKLSIAVLPFSRSTIKIDSFFVDGVIDDIRTQLSRFRGLKVISRTSSNEFASTHKSSKQIAKELNVRYLLEGTVRQRDDQIWISVQLIDVVHDELLWGDTYDRSVKEIFDIQSHVARKIASTLNQNITQEQSTWLDKPPTSELAAYHELMASRELNRIRTKKSMQESLRRLDRALELDPEYVDALAAKAATLSVMSSLGYVSDPDSTNEMAEQLALQAIKLNPLNSMAYATLGNLYYDLHKLDQCKTAFQIAIQNNPNDALANYWYSLKLRSLGQMDQAIHYGSIAAELDPLYPVILTGHALTCMMGDRMDLAEEVIEKGAVLFQNYFGYHWILGYYQMCREDFQGAVESFMKSQELSPAINSIERQIMYCKGKLGNVTEVESYIKSQEVESAASYSNLASANSGLGNKEEAKKYLMLLRESGDILAGDLYDVKFRDLFNEQERIDFLDQVH